MVGRVVRAGVDNLKRLRNAVKTWKKGTASGGRRRGELTRQQYLIEGMFVMVPMRARGRLAFVATMLVAFGVDGDAAGYGPDTTETEATAPAGFEEEWAELISAAQEEGELVIVGVSRVVEGAEVEEEFSRLFDIEVTTSTGSGNDLSSRILAERAQGLYTVDVSLFGNVRIVEAGGVFKPLMPELIPSRGDGPLYGVASRLHPMGPHGGRGRVHDPLPNRATGQYGRPLLQH